MSAGPGIRRLATDAATMLAVATLGLAVLMVVAYGAALRSSEQLFLARLATEGEIVKVSVESFLRSGLPLRQFSGFRQIAEPMVANDGALRAIEIRDRDGARIAVAGDAAIGDLGGGATWRTVDGHLVTSTPDLLQIPFSIDLADKLGDRRHRLADARPRQRARSGRAALHAGGVARILAALALAAVTAPLCRTARRGRGDASRLPILQASPPSRRRS
ncbi:MAG: hypothetical protein R3D33_10005 [Hyphomicrobiaceae bacterium]